jgi:hypothetical protein
MHGHKRLLIPEKSHRLRPSNAPTTISDRAKNRGDEQATLDSHARSQTVERPGLNRARSSMAAHFRKVAPTATKQRAKSHSRLSEERQRRTAAKTRLPLTATLGRKGSNARGLNGARSSMAPHFRKVAPIVTEQRGNSRLRPSNDGHADRAPRRAPHSSDAPSLRRTRASHSTTLAPHRPASRERAMLVP